MDFTLCLTHACNLRCAYCYAGAKSSRSMTWETARRAIDFSFDQTLRHALPGHAPSSQMGFFGGEPLLQWPLLQRATRYAVSEAQRLGIALVKTVTTNMTLLDEAKASWLNEQGFYLGLSLDGNAAMHNTLRRYRNGRGSHAACARALAFFKTPEGAPPFRAEVIMVPDPRNVQHVAESVEWLVGQGVLNISLNPNFYTEWPKAALAAWRDAYEKVGDLYQARYRAGAPVKVNVIDGKIRVHLKEGYEACDRCGFGEREAAVAPSGNLYPCERVVGDDSHEELRIGNVFEGFDPVRRLRILARRGNTVAECQACGLRARCMNWCCCINHATTGAIDQVAGIVCFHERLAIAVADRVAAALFRESNPAFLSNFYK
jgi:uncharacterized protein